MKQPLNLKFAAADENYLSVLGSKLIIGLNVSATSQADVDGVILNEAAVKALRWNLSESVIGKINEPDISRMPIFLVRSNG